MSFDGLLVYTAQVLKRTVTGEDPDDGVEEVEWVAGSSFPCWIEPRLSTQGGLRVDEHLQGRDTVTAEWMLLCKIGIDIEAYDRVQHDSKIYEVVGPPAEPGSPTPHHIEANLRFIEG